MMQKQAIRDRRMRERRRNTRQKRAAAASMKKSWMEASVSAPGGLSTGRPSSVGLDGFAKGPNPFTGSLKDLIFAAPDVRFVGTQRKDEPGPPMPEEGNRGIDGHASTLVKHLIFGRNTKFIVPPPLKVGSEFTTTSLWAKRRGLS